MPKNSNTWYVKDETKLALHDMKRVIERRLDLRSRLTQDQLMTLFVNNHENIIDHIMKSELALKAPYDFKETGVVYICPQCTEETFIRKFGSTFFKCSSCGHQYQHIDTITEDDYLDELTVNGREKTRLDVIEEIGLQLQARSDKKKK